MIVNFWAMLYAKESLKIFLSVVESQENVQGVPSVLLLSITFKVYTKIVGNYGMLSLTEQILKTSLYIEGWISHDTKSENAKKYTAISQFSVH